MTTTTTPNAARAGLPRGIWVLGFVSMLMDVSSEMIHALLPVYLVTVLGASTLTVGFIEGIAEATASITKIFSGAMSRLARPAQIARGARLRARRADKAGLPAGARSDGWLRRASSIASARAFAARRAMRWSPISRPSACAARASACGSRSTPIGAFVGPLIAIGLMWWTADNFTAVFWVAVLPAFLSFGTDRVRGERAGAGPRAGSRRRIR